MKCICLVVELLESKRKNIADSRLPVVIVTISYQGIGNDSINKKNLIRSSLLSCLVCDVSE